MRKFGLCLFYGLCVFTIAFSLFWMALPRLPLPEAPADETPPISGSVSSLVQAAAPTAAGYYLCDTGGRVAAYSRRALPRLWRDPYPGSRFSFVMQRPHASTRTAPFQRSHCAYYTINPPATTRFILQENHFFHTFCWFSIVSSRFLFKHFTQILH